MIHRLQLQLQEQGTHSPTLLVPRQTSSAWSTQSWGRIYEDTYEFVSLRNGISSRRVLRFVRVYVFEEKNEYLRKLKRNN